MISESIQWKENAMKNMKDSFKYEKGNAGCIIALIILIVIGVIIFSMPNGPAPPPISVTWRKSASLFWSGKVMQLHNESDSALSITVSGSDSKDSKKVALTISAGASRELGVMEMNWNWQSGETYVIRATGYGLPIIGTVP